MRLKLDENLGKSAAALFDAGGHDVQTVRGQGLSKGADRDVIVACQAEQRCLVTLDLDFGNPLLFDPAVYAGIVVLRLPARPSYEDLLQQCETLLAALGKRDIAGRLWIVQRGRIREYQRPEES